MFRLSGFICLVFATICGVLLFYTSQSVQRAERGLSEVSYKAISEEESLRILKAEWDYLNRPERLEKLVSGNVAIDWKSVTAENFVLSSDQIPEPVVPVLPKAKPKGFFQEVSAKRKQRVEKQQDKIQENEREGFDKLLRDVVTGGGQ